MPFLDLKSDFAFRALFTRSPNSLIHLINAVLDFQGDRQIKEIGILPSENPKETFRDKLSILDIKAINENKELLNIEMQVFPQKHYPERSLYYWARLFTSQLSQGDPYKKLRNTYAINFLDFNFIEDRLHYKSHFVIAEKDEPVLLLTETLQMIFIELPKFTQELKKVGDNLGFWLFLIKNAPQLEETDMKVLVEQNPAMKETLDVLKELSIDPELLSEQAARNKALSDYNSNIQDAEDRGREEAEAKIAKIVKKLNDKGLSVSEISNMTDLSEEEIKKLLEQ